MKKYINIAFYYAIAAMISGVFYREFTKFNGFYGVTTLGKVHPHLFLLGVLIFLLIAVFSAHLKFEEQKSFRIFLPLYNTGVILTVCMMVIRGITQVMNIVLTKAADSAISGVSGIGHMMAGAGLILLFLSLKKSIK